MSVRSSTQVKCVQLQAETARQLCPGQLNIKRQSRKGELVTNSSHVSASGEQSPASLSAADVTTQGVRYKSTELEITALQTHFLWISIN